ncbi:hypothetical protein L6164_036623 [Bauhinia variegata]|uniref:Uncharacterized protein n=1 Tax=Bauhinia variegata TaxID=167791 RepID=A0ACB9KIE5_BAUVA|nr:hypothetical protein L6164_036623 [Bauhinia variegata]
MVSIENGIPTSRIEVPHVLVVWLSAVPGPNMNRAMRNILHGARTGVALVSGTVSTTKEEIWSLGSRDYLPVHNDIVGSNCLRRCTIVFGVVEVKVDEFWWLVGGTPKRVIEWRACISCVY